MVECYIAVHAREVVTPRATGGLSRGQPPTRRADRRVPAGEKTGGSVAFDVAEPLFSTKRDIVDSSHVHSSPMSDSLKFRIAAGVMGSVFLWAGVSKLIDVQAFITAIGEFGLVWEPLLAIVAWGMIGLELLAGVGLWCGRRLAVGLAAALLSVFLCVLGYGILLGLDIECGCFGTGDGMGSLTLKQAAVLDLVLLATCGWLSRLLRQGAVVEPGIETVDGEN